MDHNARIAQHPEIEGLLAQRALLKEQLALDLARVHELLHIVKPNLLALYQLKIGAWEMRLLKVRFDVARLKRTIALAQASINRGLAPDWNAIEGELELEFLQWQQQLAQEAKKLEAASLRMDNLLSHEDSREFQKLYRALVKALHPDLNPDMDQQKKLLWMQVQDAYTTGNLEELKALAHLLETQRRVESPPDSISALQIECEKLRGHIKAAEEKAESIKSQPPFNLQQNLEDDEWVKARQMEIAGQIEEQEKQREALEALLAKWTFQTTSHGFKLGSN